MIVSDSGLTQVNSFGGLEMFCDIKKEVLICQVIEARWFFRAFEVEIESLFGFSSEKILVMIKVLY